MSLIIQYANIVHAHGLGSKQATGFRKQHADDRVFLKRAKVLDRLFLNKSALLKQDDNSHETDQKVLQKSMEEFCNNIGEGH